MNKTYMMQFRDTAEEKCVLLIKQSPQNGSHCLFGALYVVFLRIGYFLSCSETMGLIAVCLHIAPCAEF